MNNVIALFKAHKVIVVIVIAALGWGGYKFVKSRNSSEEQTRYVLASVERGTIVSSVSGSGQVSASNELELKPKASGDLVYVNAIQGQEVKAGTLLFQVDTKDVQKSIRDAQTSFETTRLSLEKSQQPPDTLSLLQAEHSLQQSIESKSSAEDDLTKAYEDGFNAVSNAFLDLPDVISGLNDILYGSTTLGGSSQWYLNYYADAVKDIDLKALQYRDETDRAYKKARSSYDASYASFRTMSRFSDSETINASINQTYDTARLISEAVKSTNNLIQFYKDKRSEAGLKSATIADTHLSSLNAYTGTTNSLLSSLLSSQRTIENDKQSIVNAERSITEKTASLAKLKAGTDPLDLRSQELGLRQKQNALADAKEKLADYSVRAPFDGIIAAVNVIKGDSVGSGTSLAMLITKQQIADVTLNEVDVAKVKVGQKVTITFDAIEQLSLTGSVLAVDTIGTTSQGVVSYTARIGFDTQDTQVKPGMTVSATIITDVKTDVLTVLNSAVKTQGTNQYVEVLDGALSANQPAQGVVSATPPRRVTVQTGVSNDTVTEIVSGLSEGDQVVSRTIASSAVSQQNNSTSGGNRTFSGAGVFGAPTGAVRVQGR